MRTASVIELIDEQRQQLQRWTGSSTVSVRLARRARIILLAAEGMDNHRIAAELSVGRVQVGRWRRRFAESGLAGIETDLPRSGRKRRINIGKVVRLTTQSTPQGATHWSTRTMAAKAGISDSSVLRIWRANGLKPHLVETFKVSRDPQFVEKLEDIVGLYLSPPEHALVLCCDEKSQVQALDRTQPGLPLKKGRAGTLTHDYKRHGTTTLFAALNTLDGSVIARCDHRHRHNEWLTFLRQIDRETPKDKALHLICDNYATHKHPKVERGSRTIRAFMCISRRPRPLGSIWSNDSSATSPPNACVVAYFAAFQNLSAPSRNISPCITTTPSPSSGQLRPMTFCRKSFAPIAA